MPKLYQTIFATLGLGLFLPGCAYRFTNTHLRPPEGIRTIAVEAIFDAQSTPLPHEILWRELQKQFAIDGRLRLTSRDRADAYLRAQVMVANINQVNDFEHSSPNYPKTFTTKNGQPYGYHDYPNLKQARSVMKQQNLTAQVQVEIWDLQKKTKLLEKIYPLNQSIPIFNALIGIDRQYINAQEAFDLSFATQSEILAKAIVTDFFNL